MNPAIQQPQEAFMKREMHEEKSEVGRDFLLCLSTKSKVQDWLVLERCSRRGSQSRDHAETVGQRQEFGFHPANCGKLPKGFK